VAIAGQGAQLLEAGQRRAVVGGPEVLECEPDRFGGGGGEPSTEGEGHREVQRPQIAAKLEAACHRECVEPVRGGLTEPEVIDDRIPVEREQPSTQRSEQLCLWGEARKEEGRDSSREQEQEGAPGKSGRGHGVFFGWAGTDSEITRGLWWVA
jgi:hypothetical protein